MLIISSSMPKSGSAYYYNVLHEALILHGQGDSRSIRSKRKLFQKIVGNDNNMVGRLKFPKLIYFTFISFFEKAFAIKTHDGPSLLIKLLLKLIWIKLIYNYRDPRDVWLSAVDYGQALKAKGKYKDVHKDDFMDTIKEWIVVWRNYDEMNNVLSISYEDFLVKPNELIKSSLIYLGVTPDESKIQSAVDKYDRSKLNAKKIENLHLNKGYHGRFKNEMDAQLLDRFNNELAGELQEMGYPLYEPDKI